MSQWLEILSGILVLAAGIVGVITLIARRAAAIEAHPPVDYLEASKPNEAPWRWRLPQRKVDLKVFDDETSSRIEVPHEVFWWEKLVQVGGYLMLGVTIVAPGSMLARQLSGFNVDGAALFMALVLTPMLFAPIGWVMLKMGSRVKEITLTQDELRITRSFALFFQPTLRLSRSALVRISGSIQSSMEMIEDQEMPEYKIHISRGWLRPSTKLYLRCSPTQGSWIAGGLQAWVEQSQPQDGR